WFDFIHAGGDQAVAKTCFTPRSRAPRSTRACPPSRATTGRVQLKVPRFGSIVGTAEEPPAPISMRTMESPAPFFVEKRRLSRWLRADDGSPANQRPAPSPVDTPKPSILCSRPLKLTITGEADAALQAGVAVGHGRG